MCAAASWLGQRRCFLTTAGRHSKSRYRSPRGGFCHAPLDQRRCTTSPVVISRVTCFVRTTSIPSGLHIDRDALDVTLSPTCSTRTGRPSVERQAR